MCNLKEGYKQTKVGVIPEDWEVVKLGKLAAIETGKTPLRSKDSFWHNATIPWATTTEVNKKYIISTKEKISQSAIDELKLKIFPENTILLAMYGQGKTRGKVALLRIESTINQAFAAIKPNDKYVTNFLFNYLNKSYMRIREMSHGSNQDNLNLDIIKMISIPFPPLKEQQKIAQILSTWDDAISRQEALIKAKEQLRKGLMQKLLSGEVRFGEFDGEWEEVKLGDIAEIKTGSSNREDSTEEDGKYTFFDRSEDIRTSSRYLFDGEAIIVAGEGQRFIPKYFIGKFDLHQRTYSIMNFQKSIGKYLLYYIWQNSNYFLSQAVGSTVKSLRLPMFKKMKIKLPLLKEQQKIAQVLTTVDKEIELLKKELEVLKEQKRGLMQRLLMGEVRV